MGNGDEVEIQPIPTMYYPSPNGNSTVAVLLASTSRPEPSILKKVTLVLVE